MIRPLILRAIAIAGVCCPSMLMHAQVCCNQPLWETSHFSHAYSPYTSYEYMVAFSAEVSDGGSSFDYGTITESTASPGDNTCGSGATGLSPHPVISQNIGIWHVAQGDVAGIHNTYGNDIVGMDIDDINAIRDAYDSSGGGQWACSYTIFQNLTYVCNGSSGVPPPPPYWDNIINITITDINEQVGRGTAVYTINH